MTDLLRRLSILFLVLLIVMGTADHLFLSSTSTSHLAQEASCPLHGGVIQLERTQPLLHVSVQLNGEVQDSSHAFDLSAKISHPPTIL